ncbi:MAG: adenosylcobinamide-phosphate synthase CbiB [Candidatus Magnetominusculus sp. LBB02]|nr:adenosylcobinamide-phosphate synthase CbiB [Candidatus Magnetominusculus sp. LBB02]
MFLLTGIPAQLLTAFAVDICAGDPAWITHPVIYIGRLIEFLDRRLRVPGRSPLFNVLAGAGAVTVTVGLTYALTYLFTDFLLLPLKKYLLFSKISLYDLAIGVTGSVVLAQNGLIMAVLLVRDKLMADDIAGAREALSLIVGRDTKALTHEGIARAAIETAAENASDAVIAPLFYFVIGGLPLAMAYKAVNTLDSMIGYKNDKYLHFGKAAARLDDAANYIPARLTGAAIVIAVFAITAVKLLRYGRNGAPAMNNGEAINGHVGRTTAAFSESLKTLLRDGRKHSSPNAGYPEAAMAGALGVRLGGPSYYGGILVVKPYIGSGREPVSPAKITAAAEITAVSSLIGFLMLMLLLAVTEAVAADNMTQLAGNIFTDAAAPQTVLLVDKRTSELYIAEVKGNMPRITKSYSAMYGKNDGDKFKEGDNKTPEGFYYITGFIPRGKLDSVLYGDGAYTLNYPNIMDRVEGKTGHGIWIHGRCPERNNERTQGCVALSNNDLTDLRGYIVSGTPVIISDRLEFMAAAEYAKSRKQYMEMFSGFIKSWEKGDFEGFTNFFDTKFRGYDGLTAKDYLNKKRRLMAAQPKRKIIVSNVNIYKGAASKLMYSFDQLYCAAGALSFGGKRLYLTAERQGDYRIIAEEFKERDIEPTIEPYVDAAIKKWKAAWQAKDLENYIAHYSSAFRADSMDVKQWKAYKKSIFKKSKSIKISLTDMKIKDVSPERIVVTFIQKYTAGSVSDTGIKTLVLCGCPGDFRIVEEMWRPA